MRDHEVAQGADSFAARHKAAAGALVGHQVDVALAVFDFLVVHAVELVWHGTQAFGQQTHDGGVDGEFTGFGFENPTFCGHDVAQVPVLEIFVERLADFLALDIYLDASTAGSE